MPHIARFALESLRDTMTVTRSRAAAMRSIPRDQWRAKLAGEVAAWAAWFDRALGGTADKDVAEDYAWRLDPNANVSSHDYLIAYMRQGNPPGAAMNVLDVGAGPLTFFPKQWVTRTMTITPIDPLAREYDALLKDKGIEP